MRYVFIGGDSAAAEMVELGVRTSWPDAESLRATTAREGLEIVSGKSPDVILLHAGISDMSLQEAIQRLRQFPHTPLLVLSETDDEMEIITALESGADDYLRIPFDINVLIARVEAILRRLQVPYGPLNEMSMV